MTSSASPSIASEPFRYPRLALGVTVILTGLTAGVAGMLLGMLLHVVQHLAYGYSLDSILSHETFLMGVSAASPQRRVSALLACGLVAGLGWWALYRYGRPLVSIKSAVADPSKPMPARATLIHALLQIVTVGLGSPLGREVAPREVGALCGGYLSKWARLTTEHRRMVIACGAGAGLAAVYNVPLGGAVFVLEVLLGTFGWVAVCMALATSAIAASIAWIGLGGGSQYIVPHFLTSPSLMAFAVVVGPLFGIAAYGFVRLTSAARQHAPKDWRLPVFAFINFALIGGLAIYFPQLLGNGKGPAQMGFDNELVIGFAAILLVLKVLVTTSSLRAGAQGGLLTPGLAIGALMAVVLGGLWSLGWPGVPLGAFAIVGAAAFLASSMSMPLTAVVLVAEFTRVDHDFLVPIILAVVGSVCASRFCEYRNRAVRGVS